MLRFVKSTTQRCGGFGLHIFVEQLVNVVKRLRGVNVLQEHNVCYFLETFNSLEKHYE